MLFNPCFAMILIAFPRLAWQLMKPLRYMDRLLTAPKSSSPTAVICGVFPVTVAMRDSLQPVVMRGSRFFPPMEIGSLSRDSMTATLIPT